MSMEILMESPGFTGIDLNSVLRSCKYIFLRELILTCSTNLEERFSARENSG